MNAARVMWGVWCEVSGGVTGYRAAWLKDSEGKIARFDSAESATEVAVFHSDQRNGNPNRTATFHYAARKI